MTSQEALLHPLEAAHRLGITSELLFQYTKTGFAKTSGLRSLKTVEDSGKTKFSITELDAFDSLLAGSWPFDGERRPAIPKAIVDHLKAEALNQCARCGSGIGIDTAHIQPWAECYSHYHANLIRLCSACHREHDVQHSLPTEELLALKQAAIARTRANLLARLQPTPLVGHAPRAAVHFFGREDELEVLVNALRSGRSVLITGVGGIGKTELLTRALREMETGRPVLWVDVEQYRTAADIFAALRTSLGNEGVACPEHLLPSRLDEMQACLIFDGIERATLNDLDGFEDAVASLHAATAYAQVVATSQVMLHKLAADAWIKLDRLDEPASRRLLEGRGTVGTGKDLDQLLDFCEGHALTLRLASALIEHYNGPLAALKVIETKGVTVVSLPGRTRQDRARSLELCLQTAYDALSVGARTLLCTLAEAPAGVFTHYLDRDWAGLEEPGETLAELRRWHLVDIVATEDRPERTHVLRPVRAFAIERLRRDDSVGYTAAMAELVYAQGMIVAVLELNYADPDNTPHALGRYGEELPNLLHCLELARLDPKNEEMLQTAVSIVRSLMRYFFVLGLTEQGARVMRDAARLALDAGLVKAAGASIMQFGGLAMRTGDDALLDEVLGLADELEQRAGESEARADIAMTRGMIAKQRNDNPSAEAYAREALSGYEAHLRAAKEQHQEMLPDQHPSPVDLEGMHNDLASAFSLLGFSLLALRRFDEAAKAYEHSLQHERGASIAVNRGQTLHQLGNCKANLGQHREAAAHYVEAAKIFHFVGMEEYLSTALSELGYALLDVEAEDLLDEFDMGIVLSGMNDFERDAKRAFDPSRPLDHVRCVGIIRKSFGFIALLSLVGQGRLIEALVAPIGSDILVPYAALLDKGELSPDERFPLAMIDTSLRIGLLVAQGERDFDALGDVSQDTIGDILKMVCNAHDWAHEALRLTDWLAVYLTRNWRYEDVSRDRVHEFVQNYRDDVVDYLDLNREN